MVKKIDCKEQQILGGVLVKKIKETDTAQGPCTKRAVRIEKTRMGFCVYGKGANRNKLVVHTIYPPANRSNLPKEKVPLDEIVLQLFLGFFGGIYNDAYEISKFCIVHNKTSSKVVLHPATVELNRKTIIVPIDKTNQKIPTQWFNLIDLAQLHKRINNDAELTCNKFIVDVFDCLTVVQSIEEVTIQNSRIAKKRNLNVQNIRGETVRITLWGEATTSFKDIGMQSLLPPIFVALTSLKVKQYQGNPVLGSTGSIVCVFNPDIPQLSQYKQKFEHLRSPVQILCTLAEMYVDRAIGPSITECKGWWYKSCPSYHKAVKKTFGLFECNEHGLLNRIPEPW
ncbi:hypothetical protein DVH24_015534 [Malus domestica]|uniref:Replication protein A OB domain-containing protein n=1 Tax=Malus domestica TaxID=3750 RepID=A0A498HLX3_MALDO|nr:hypothetical protein DVH24_015534 [Malus domestica]